MYYYIKIISLLYNIDNIDVFSLNDLYVEIQYNDDIRTTITKWDQKNPEWNEIFLFPGKAKNISIRLLENNKWTKSSIVIENTLEILDDGTLSTCKCAGLLIEHGYVTVKSARNQIQTMENLGSIAQTMGDSFKNLTESLKELTL